MQKVSKFAIIVACAFNIGCYAQSSTSTTLSQAIETAKARKAVEFNALARSNGGVSPLPSDAVEKPKVIQTPLKLWSIQGVGNSLYAEVIYQKRIYEVSFANDIVRIGDWLLTELTNEEAKFIRTGNHSSSNAMSLKMQRNGQTTHQAFAVSVTENTTTSSSRALDEVTPLSTNERAPVPFELLKR